MTRAAPVLCCGRLICEGGAACKIGRLPWPSPYYGWYVVAACATIACFSWGFAFYGLGVYLHVLVRLHGWSTGPISVAVTAYYLIGAVLIIAVGRLIDRHGPSGVLAYGVCAMAGALALLGPDHRVVAALRRVRVARDGLGLPQLDEPQRDTAAVVPPPPGAWR